MNYAAIIGSGILTVVTLQAAVASPPSAMSRRQHNGCMTKQMTASRTISYNEASRLCRDQLKSQSDALADTRNDILTANEAKPANAR